MVVKRQTDVSLNSIYNIKNFKEDNIYGNRVRINAS